MPDFFSFNDRAQPTIDALSSGDFDAQGMNSTTFLPSISPLPGLPGSTSKGGVLSSGSAAGNAPFDVAGAGMGIPGPSANSGPAASSIGGSGAGTSGGMAGGSVADYFARGVLVILGMIFVAVGLHLFAPSAVPDVRRVVT